MQIQEGEWQKEVSGTKSPSWPFPPLWCLCAFSSDDRQVKWGGRQQHLESSLLLEFRCSGNWGGPNQCGYCQHPVICHLP